ncbi:MAG: MFS transporter [Chloroflexota bacterium]|nr:MFS transporter [Chloroflexota bacterium]
MQQSHGQQATNRSHLALGGRTILPGLSTGHVVYHWILQSFVVLLPEIQAAFSLSAVGVGGLVSARELAAGVVALPGGVATDMVRRYWGRLLVACLLASALGALAMGLSPVYVLLLAGIAVLAAAHSIWHLAASGSLSYHYERRRGTALSLHGVGGSIGDVAGPLVTGALLLFLAWQDIISLYAAAPILLGLVAIWAFRNIGHTREELPAEDLAARVRVTRELLKSRLLWGLTLVRGFRAMALAALVTILPLYLSNDLGMSEWNRGFHIGLLIAVGLVAKTGAGYLSDRWGRKQVLVPGLAWSCLIALVLLVFNSGPMLSVSIALLGLFLYPDQPILTATIYDTLGREVATTGLGAVAFVSFLMAAGSSVAAGALYEWTGFQGAVWYISGLFALAAVVFAVLPLAGCQSRAPAG